MNSPGHKLLACPAFAGDEHGALGGRNRADRAADLEHLLAFPHNLIAVEGLEQDLALPGIALLFRERSLRPAISLLQCPADQTSDFVLVLEGLDQIPESAVLLGVDGRVWGGVRGDEDEDGFRRQFFPLLEQIDARHFRHPDVGNNEIKLSLLELAEGLPGRRRPQDVHASVLEVLFKELEDIGFVVYKQNRRHVSQL